MRHTRVRARLAIGALLMLITLAAVPAAASAAKPAYRVMVFSKTAAFRHDSIPDGITAIRNLGKQNNFQVTATEDATAFTDGSLKNYAAVVFLSTTGDVLNTAQQAAFERYVKAGGGYVGIHAAADTEYDWAFYGELVGTYFQSHPAIQPATVKVADRVHGSTKDLPERWQRTDEWYSYRGNPRGKVHVLATLDENTYSGGAMGYDHPIAWCHDYQGGRSWYTGGGHTKAAYGEPPFLKHLLGGIEWAAGAAMGDCGATVEANYQKVTLNSRPGEPMALAVLPDGRVLHTTRNGNIWQHDPKDDSNRIIASFGASELYSHDEEGLQSIAIDPEFAQNHWLYLYYSPRQSTPTGDAPDQLPAGQDASYWGRWKGDIHLSRFKLDGETLDKGSEQVLLKVGVSRGICCHVGGKIDFDGAGNLFLSTGDDSNPFQSDGFAPIDERPNRNPAFDAQRSAANTDDLRGKVLRIHPQANGSYTIPQGNLFAPGTAKTRPEIYAMGLRNPFRFTVDPNGVVYLGDYSPDAGTADPLRGPPGTGKWTAIRQAGNYGWPYCATRDLAYNDYDFATGQSGPKFDCAHPVNESPNNTGARELPAVQQPLVHYSYDRSSAFPELLTGGVGPMGGPVYRYDAGLKSATKFPAYYDGVPFMGEWTRDWIKELRLDAAGGLLKINPVLPGTVFDNPMDMEFGPDGALYVLEYGDGFFSENPDAQLARVDYVKGARAPRAVASATPTNGRAPLAVQFSSAGSNDPDPGDSISFAWDFQGDGTTDAAGPSASFTYTANGVYQARLTVTDSSGKTGTDTVTITVGNTAPKVTFTQPPDGGFFHFGEKVDYDLTVTDPEDGQVDCSKVKVSFILGHDMHGHPLTETAGCRGTIQTVSDSGHSADANTFGVIDASYTDNGGSGAPALSGSAQLVLQPHRKQAEFFSSQQGVQTESTGDTQGGGQNIGFIDSGDWVSYKPMNLRGITSLSYRAASAGAGGEIEVHVDSPTGPLISTATIPVSGDWQSYTDVSNVPVTDPGGTHELFFVFKNGTASGLFNLNWIDFDGPGVGHP